MTDRILYHGHGDVAVTLAVAGAAIEHAEA